MIDKSITRGIFSRSTTDKKTVENQLNGIKIDKFFQAFKMFWTVLLVGVILAVNADEVNELIFLVIRFIVMYFWWI